MLKLMKYELLKKKKLLAISLSTLFLLEGIFLLSIHKGESWFGAAIISIVLMCVGVFIFVLFDAIYAYSSDLNKKQGYMLFLAPVSGYKIIGSKALIGFIELLFFGSITFLFMLVNFNLSKEIIFQSFGPEFLMVVNQVKEVYSVITPSVFQIIILVFDQIVQWFGLIMVVYLAITIRKTILANTKFGGLISFILFIIIYAVMSTINSVVIASFSFFNDYANMVTELGNGIAVNYNDFANLILGFVIIDIIMYSIFIGIFYYFSSRLLNKKVDL